MNCMFNHDSLIKHGYFPTSVIGLGGFSMCILCSNKRYPGVNFVAKIIPVEDEESKGLYMSEITALMKIDCPNVVMIYDYFEEEGFLTIILEFCENGSVDQLIDYKGGINEKLVRKYMRSILLAMGQLHDNHMAHHDIKPANFLIDHYDRVKLADFGISRTYADGELSTLDISTLPYCAPEMIYGDPYDPFKADVYAFGVALYEMIVGELPMEADSDEALAELIVQGRYHIPHTVPRDIALAIQSCMNPNPKFRPTIKELLNNTFPAFGMSLSNPSFRSNSIVRGLPFLTRTFVKRPTEAGKLLKQNSALRVLPPLSFAK